MTDQATRDKRIFREVFNFLVAHAQPTRDEVYWTQTAEDAGRVCALLGSDPFAVDLLAVIYQELERRCLNEQQDSGRF